MVSDLEFGLVYGAGVNGLTSKPFTVAYREGVEWETLTVRRYVEAECWTSGCHKPATYVLRTLVDYPEDETGRMTWIQETAYCWGCLGWFATNWIRYPDEQFPLGYFHVGQVEEDWA